MLIWETFNKWSHFQPAIFNLSFSNNWKITQCVYLSLCLFILHIIYNIHNILMLMLQINVNLFTLFTICLEVTKWGCILECELFIILTHCLISYFIIFVLFYFCQLFSNTNKALPPFPPLRNALCWHTVVLVVVKAHKQDMLLSSFLTVSHFISLFGTSSLLVYRFECVYWRGGGPEDWGQRGHHHDQASAI